jgi:hypothetical protein
MSIMLPVAVCDVPLPQLPSAPRGGRGWRVAPLRLAAVLFASIVMSGCSTFAPGASTTPPPVSFTCHSAQQCTVKVVVDCAHSPCTITVPGADNVAANGFDVVWEIVPAAGQSYVFKNPGGISFKTQEGAASFSCHAEMNDTRYRCHGNRNGNAYEYGIELVGTPQVAILDPWIVNR